MVHWRKQLKSSSEAPSRTKDFDSKTKTKTLSKCLKKLLGKTFRQTGFHLTSKIFAAISLNIFFSFWQTEGYCRKGGLLGYIITHICLATSGASLTKVGIDELKGIY